MGIEHQYFALLNLSSNFAGSFLDSLHDILADWITARGIKEKIRTWDEYQEVFWNNNSRVSQDITRCEYRYDQVTTGIVVNGLAMLTYPDQLKDIHWQAKPVDRNTITLQDREFGEAIAKLKSIIEDVYWRIPFCKRPKANITHGLSQLKSSIKASIRR